MISFDSCERDSLVVAGQKVSDPQLKGSSLQCLCTNFSDLLRALQDILVIDNDEERLIRDEVQVHNKGSVKSAIRKGARQKGKDVQRGKMKSTVARPDIRIWLDSRKESQKLGDLRKI